MERSAYRNAERTCSQPKLDNMQECLPCMAKCLDKLVIQSHPKVKYMFIKTPLKFGCIFSEALYVSSLELHPGGLNYSLSLQRHTGQTAVLQALTLGHMRSNNYSTTQIFVDNFLLLKMSTNHCTPSHHRMLL